MYGREMVVQFSITRAWNVVFMLVIYDDIHPNCEMSDFPRKQYNKITSSFFVQ